MPKRTCPDTTNAGFGQTFLVNGNRYTRRRGCGKSYAWIEREEVSFEKRLFNVFRGEAQLRQIQSLRFGKLMRSFLQKPTAGTKAAATTAMQGARDYD